MDEQIDIKRVQKVLLEMGTSVASILEANSIPYMITYGTLLGAVRHKGFIPWDDDFDFYLFDDTYDEAIEILRSELPKNMFLEDSKSEPLYFHGWAHVKDINSSVFHSLFPRDSLYKHKGISLDLYRTKKMMRSELDSYLNSENRSYILRLKEKGLIEDDEYNKRMLLLNENIKNSLDFNEEDTEGFSLLPVYKCHFIRTEDIFPLKKYIFEDYEFWGPNNSKKFLTDIYGDYMQLPPEEKRIPHYSSVTFIDNNN